MLIGFQITVLIMQAALGVLVGYLFVLTLASLRASQQTQLPAEPQKKRFLILVPAHNEELLLPGLLENLAQLDYPKDSYAVHVVADNCTDQTASVARAMHVHVHERTHETLLGKGYALNWLMQELRQAKVPHDAVLILDADSLISNNFLQVMAAHLAQGEDAIQAYYAVRDPDRSWNVSLRYLALAVLHYLRPLGRMVLGGSVGLKGNGMVFSAQILRRFEWSASVTEDIEMHMALILSDQRVTFAPDAIVWGEMPDSLSQARSQHTRWEQGRLQMARRYVPSLLRKAGAAMRSGDFRRAFLLVDAVMEHIIPPFSILAALSMLALITGLAGWLVQMFVLPGVDNIAHRLGLFNIVLGLVLILAQFIYVFVGLRLVRAPARVYRALFYAPVLVFWKIGHYLQVLLGRSRQGWVRTARNEG